MKPTKPARKRLGLKKADVTELAAARGGLLGVRLTSGCAPTQGLHGEGVTCYMCVDRLKYY